MCYSNSVMRSDCCEDWYSSFNEIAIDFQQNIFIKTNRIGENVFIDIFFMIFSRWVYYREYIHNILDVNMKIGYFIAQFQPNEWQAKIKWQYENFFPSFDRKIQYIHIHLFVCNNSCYFFMLFHTAIIRAEEQRW